MSMRPQITGYPNEHFLALNSLQKNSKGSAIHTDTFFTSRPLIPNQRPAARSIATQVFVVEGISWWVSVYSVKDRADIFQQFFFANCVVCLCNFQHPLPPYRRPHPYRQISSVFNEAAKKPSLGGNLPQCPGALLGRVHQNQKCDNRVVQDFLVSSPSPCTLLDKEAVRIQATRPKTI